MTGFNVLYLKMNPKNYDTREYKSNLTDTRNDPIIDVVPRI